MALDLAKMAPGQSDINNEFSTQKIKQTLMDYKALKNSAGDYQFGSITARHYNLDPNSQAAWQNEIATYPTDVQDEIKRTIIYALNNTDDNGNDAPIPIAFTWKKKDSPGVSISYIPYGQKNGPAYLITISGYDAPLASSLAERIKKGKER